VQAQDYPTKIVRIICAHAAGGGADQLTRIVAEGLTTALGRPVVVENRPGAGTMIAAEYVAKTPADGYTLLMSTVTTLSINPSLYDKIKYDSVKDFAPITIVASTPFFLGATPSLPAKSVRDVIQLAKQKPNAMNYGSSGNGTSSHLAGELFNQMAGVRIVHVPYKATSTRAVDLASGMIELVFGNDLLPFARAGKVRILGVTSARRLSGYPEIPTVAEAGGLKNYEASVWYGFVAPAGTPAPIVEKLNAAIKKTLARPEVKQIVMTALGGDVVGNSPEQFASVIKTDLQKWDQVIKRARIIASD
jgi:tripartite-type tricarboxylate transporter receptor subunit TctC